MDEYDKKPEMTGETKTVELTPELQAKLDQIKLNETVSVKKTDRKIGHLIVAIIVLLAISGSAIALTVIKGGNKDGKKDDAVAEKQEPLEITTVEKKEMYNTIALLNFSNIESDANKDFIDTGNFRSTAFMLTDIPNLYKNEGYTKKQKLFAILYNARHYEKKFEKVSTESYSEADFKKYMDENKYLTWDIIKESVSVLPVEYVETKYKELFGEDVENQDAADYCGGFLYDKELGVYIAGLRDGCGGLDARSVILHVFNLGSTTEEYFVDANVATLYNSSYDIDNAKCNVYDDVYEDTDTAIKNIYKNCKYDSKGSTDFVLTDEDTSSVAKYRFTFDKDRHFKSIKKLD